MELTWHDLPEVLGVIVPILMAALMWYLSRQFASKADLSEIKTRLEEGEVRFNALERAILDASLSAKGAKDAADRVQDAAEKVYRVEVNIAELRGDIKALAASLKHIDRFGEMMVHGHLNLGGKP